MKSRVSKALDSKQLPRQRRADEAVKSFCRRWFHRVTALTYRWLNLPLFVGTSTVVARHLNALPSL
jgi:hypothetical protein